MTVKTEIIERLGEAVVLLPDLIASALDANDRAKLRLTLLQAAAAHASDPSRPTHDLATERRAAGLDDPAFDRMVAGARILDDGRVEIPGASRMSEGLHRDIAAMIDAVRAADSAAAEPFAARLNVLVPDSSGAGDVLPRAKVSAMTSARRGANDSEHLLIMDLHKAVNRVAEQTAVETVDGARTHRLDPDDRLRVQAFMRGLSRTAPLAFGHPGLGTTAARTASRLIIQNDIGTTDAHVIVVHVEALTASVTYTDVHRARTEFFMSLFDGSGVEWSPLSEQTADGLADGEAFYLVTGRRQATDAGELDGFLEHLGSRLVFLIDWNKARKALQTFVNKGAAVALLAEAAERDLGHRGFLELGGAELVLDAIRHVAAGRAQYGVRLDAVLGEAETRGFLADVLRIASEGLSASRTTRLLHDEIQAELARRLESLQGGYLSTTVRHLGLSRMLAAEIRDALSPGMAPAADRSALAERATRLEKKGDRLTLEAREMAARLAEADPNLRQVIDHAEEALDALDEAAFLFSLAPDAAGDAEFVEPLAALAELAVESAGQMVRACEAASRTPQGYRQDSTEALQAIDAVSSAEHAADEAERRMIAALMRKPPPDPRIPILGMELAHVIELSTDHLSHAALALRDHLLKDLSL